MTATVHAHSNQPASAPASAVADSLQAPAPERWLEALGLPTEPHAEHGWRPAADIAPETLSGALEDMLSGPAPLGDH